MQPVLLTMWRVVGGDVEICICVHGGVCRESTPCTPSGRPESGV